MKYVGLHRNVANNVQNIEKISIYHLRIKVIIYMKFCCYKGAMMINVKPNVKKTLESMKSSGYSFTHAIADIVDNSIDAGANEIEIKVDLESESIKIVDNGMGMSFERIVEALRLGSETSKEANELGKYGFGLKSASFSQCNIITVVSKKEEANEVTFDINKSIEQDDWIAERTSNFKDLIKTDTGTVIVWNDLYRLGLNEEDRQDRLITYMEELRLFLCKTFYQFIDSGIVFKLNGVELKSQSPFYETNPATKQLNTDIMAFGNDEIKLTAYDISSVKRGGHDINLLVEQGISVFRNNRYISNIGWLSRMPHQSLNMIRIRMDVGSKEDYLLNIDFKKSNVELPSSLKQQIKTFEKTVFSTYNKRGKTVATRKKNKLVESDIDLMQTSSKINSRNAINQMYLNSLGISARELNEYLGNLNKLNSIKEKNKISGNEEQFLYELLEELVSSGKVTYEELLYTEPLNRYHEIVENYRREHE